MSPRSGVSIYNGFPWLQRVWGDEVAVSFSLGFDFFPNLAKQNCFAVLPGLFRNAKRHFQKKEKVVPPEQPPPQ